jgi:hypothetical protein
MKELETSLYAEDRKSLDWKLSKNRLEAYSYEVRGNLEQYGSWENYLEPTAKAELLAEIGTVVEWLYGEGENAPLKEFTDRI